MAIFDYWELFNLKIYLEYLDILEYSDIWNIRRVDIGSCRRDSDSCEIYGDEGSTTVELPLRLNLQ